MIALPNEFPLIKVKENYLLRYESKWLNNVIFNSVKEANIPNWVVNDIVDGMNTFLKYHYHSFYIDINILFDLIDDGLSKVGFNGEFSKIKRTIPPIKISISEIARRSNCKYELFFFKILKKELFSIGEKNINLVEFYNIKKGIKYIYTCDKWTKKCNLLYDEIINFIKEINKEIIKINPNFKAIII